MSEAENDSAILERLRDGTENENNSCRDMTPVTEDRTLQEDIVHITDKEQ
ncbi:hypothetical protein [Cohnella kolymensis]|nr:hypothetical protein [Cohnella kolymensis]